MDYDDTDMTEEEFDATKATGQPVRIVKSRADFVVATVEPSPQRCSMTWSYAPTKVFYRVGGLMVEADGNYFATPSFEHRQAFTEAWDREPADA